MKLEELNKKYDKLQKKYGAKELDSIYNGGCSSEPEVCFVFMNPTGRNIASLKSWKGIKSPWIGTKNIWDLFYAVNLLGEDIYRRIKEIKGNDWTYEFAEEVYGEVRKQKYFITNLGKCTQIDARPLSDKVYKEYLDLFWEEMSIVKPKTIILFGNQVSSLILDEKVSVSQTRKRLFEKEVNGNRYRCYAVFYPVGNGRFNIDKSIEDIKWIMEKENDFSRCVK